MYMPIILTINFQKRDREKLNTEYEKQVKTLFAQWETDIARVKENEEKFNVILS